MALTCKKITQERLLKDILDSVVDSVGGGWKVLILDDVTKRIFSSCLKMSDIVDSKVSTVENLYKQREPLSLAAVYFITPTVKSIVRMQEDFLKQPLYPSVHVFFTSRVPAEALQAIKQKPLLIQRLKTMKEVNLEYLTVDSRTIVTEQPDSLIQLMGEKCEDPQNRKAYEEELDTMASRLVTLLCTLNEFPSVRYRPGKAEEPGDPPGAQARFTLCHRLAEKVTEKAMKLQRVNQLPGQETCDLLILDRSFDPVATVIHEWTYEAMVYDLLKVDGNLYTYETESQAGKMENRETVLEEADEMWSSLRHMHIAEVYQNVYKKLQDFQGKYKALAGRAAGGGQVTDIKRMIVAMPQYREALSRLGFHVHLSTEIKNATNWRHLTDVGDLEQNLVYGDKNSKELINFMIDPKNQDLDRMDKIRLFMCYVATHPGKLDSTVNRQWQQVANLSAQEMNAVCNLAFLGVNVWRANQDRAGLQFSRKKKDKALYKQREGREELYTLGKFEPLLAEVVEDWAGGKLPADQYPYIREPPAGSTQPAAGPTAKSARQNRAGINWAKKPGADGGNGAGAVGGRRMIVFVVGGVMRSEMRIAHQLSNRLGRDIILASTSVESPVSFISTLARMNNMSDEFVS